jgi:hypothetical protein
LYQHKDNFGLGHWNSNFPAVMQGDVCDRAKPREDQYNSSLRSVSFQQYKLYGVSASGADTILRRDELLPNL